MDTADELRASYIDTADKLRAKYREDMEALQRACPHKKEDLIKYGWSLTGLVCGKCEKVLDKTDLAEWECDQCGEPAQYMAHSIKYCSKHWDDYLSIT